MQYGTQRYTGTIWQNLAHDLYEIFGPSNLTNDVPSRKIGKRR
jgi:hypothetical protein